MTQGIDRDGWDDSGMDKDGWDGSGDRQRWLGWLREEKR
jgi:hypothetical protein